MNRGNPGAVFLMFILHFVACAGWQLWLGDPCLLAELSNTLNSASEYGIQACLPDPSSIHNLVRAAMLVMLIAAATLMIMRARPAVSRLSAALSALLATLLVQLLWMHLRGSLPYVLGAKAEWEYARPALTGTSICLALAAAGAWLGATLARRRRVTIS
jgi:hypothetical protein